MSDILRQSPHIVAHLDFLGARNKMRSQEDRELFLQQIYDVFTSTDSQLARMAHSMQKSMYNRIFSDNILVAQAVEQDMGFNLCLFRVINFCTLFQFLALTKGLFVRGAIVYGDLVCNDIFVFGEALVNAYEAETSRAIYPRIIIDDIIMDHFSTRQMDHIAEDPFWNQLLRRDFDGQWYISPFGKVRYPFADMRELLQKARHFIVNEYQKGKFLQKYYWLVNVFNCFCNDHVGYEDLKILLSEIENYTVEK